MNRVEGDTSKGCTLRAVIIGFVLLPLNAYWIAQTEIVWHAIWPTLMSLFFNVIFILFILLGLNSLVKNWLPKAALTQKELLLIYIILCMGTSVAGNNFLENIVSTIGHGFWFATPENEWTVLFWRYIPTWLTISDKKILSGFYEGDSTLYTASHLNAWATIMVPWFVFILVFVFVMMCISVILRKQWTEKEKLAYPIIQIPIEMTKVGTFSGLFRNPLFIVGFAATAFINIINGLNYLYPSVPYLRLKIPDISYLFSTKPWNAMGWMPIAIYPSVVGITFFIPSDLAFSCWFFYLFRKMLSVALNMVGQSPSSFSGGYYPFADGAAGGWLAISLIALWMTRRHIRAVCARVIKGREIADDSNEPMSYRFAVLGIAAGFCFMLAFCIVGGMSLSIAAAFLLLVFALEIAITRIRAELGPPEHGMEWRGADYIIVSVLGTRRMNAATCTMMSLLSFSCRSVGSHPMPHQLEAFKISERLNLNNRRLIVVIMSATAIGVISSFWAILHFSYKFGADVGCSYVWIASEAFHRLAWWLQYPTTANRSNIIFMGVGMLFSIILMIMKSRFLWWPLHPAGYAICISGWFINWLWFSIFVSWIVKIIILRYGGIKTYRKSVPLFIGFVLGEYVIGCSWSILGTVLGMRMYAFFDF